MPALVWLGRRWRVATDDFTIPCLWSSAVLIFSWILLFIYFYDCKSALLQLDKFHTTECAVIPITLRRLILTLLIVVLVEVICFFITAMLSLRGAIFEDSKRRLVPYFLYIDSVCVGMILVVAILCLKYIVHDGGLDMIRDRGKVIVLACLGLDLIVSFAYLGFFALAFDCGGRKTYDSFEEYERVWASRLSCLCCFVKDPPEEDPGYGTVAHTFAEAFAAYDVVPSDIAAGMFLLHARQRHARQANALLPTYPPAGDGWKERAYHRARLAPRLTLEERAVVRELEAYQVYFLAILGWPFYAFESCGWRLCGLWARNPFFCCRDPNERYYGVRSNCDWLVLHEVSGLLEEDILLANWTNGPFQPVYYVAHNPTTNTVIIAIRGTMSIADCVTDFTATPELIELADAADGAYGPEDYYAHMGMLRGARYILDFMEEAGLLRALERGRFADAAIRVVGHSLGAGVALLLAVLMWSRRRGLRGRLRGLAYAPPGCTMSAAVMAYCRDFTVGCLLGADVVPRLTPQSFAGFREALLDALAACALPKTLLWANLWRIPAVAGALDSPASPARREAPQAAPSAPRPLHPCARLLHLQKAVARTRPFRARIRRGRPLAAREVVHLPCFVGPAELQTVLASGTMFADHMPDRLTKALSKTVKRMDAGELERFFTDEDEGGGEGGSSASNHAVYHAEG